MTVFTIKEGDTLPELTTTLGIDLTTSTVRQIRLRLDDGTVVLEEDATLVSPATAGRLKYKFASGEVSTGEYYVEWVVEFSGGGKQVFPTNSYDILKVVPIL